MGVEIGGGDGGRVPPPVEKSAGDVPPEQRIFQYFLFLERINFLHFEAFSKQSGRNPRRN